MQKEEITERLREICNKAVKELTSEDIEFVTTLAGFHNVDIKRRGCKSCIVDAAVAVYKILTNGEDEEPKDDARKYVLRDGVDVLFNGIRINAATLTDKMAAALIEEGFDTSLFATLPHDED